MIQDVKDTAATATTIAGTGAVVMDLNEVLSLVLILTGIGLNLVRIIELKRKKGKD